MNAVEKAYGLMKKASEASTARDWRNASHLFEQAKDAFREAARELGADPVDKREWLFLASKAQAYEIDAMQRFQEAPGRRSGW